VPDIERLEVPVKLRLELGPVIGLDHEHAKRQAPHDLIDEEAGRTLVAGVVDLEHPNPGAIIDRGELIEAAARSGDALQKLHVQLQAVPRLRLLVALPAPAVRLVLLIGRQPAHAVPRQDAMDGRDGDGNPVEPLQVRRDPAGAEVIVLPQVQDLADHIGGGGPVRMMWRPRPIAQAGVAMLRVPPLPLVERFPGDPEPTADAGNIALVGRLP
jgi:hypothetical protein